MRPTSSQTPNIGKMSDFGSEVECRTVICFLKASLWYSLTLGAVSADKEECISYISLILYTPILMSLVTGARGCCGLLGGQLFNNH